MLLVGALGSFRLLLPRSLVCGVALRPRARLPYGGKGWSHAPLLPAAKEAAMYCTNIIKSLVKCILCCDWWV